MLTMHDEPTRRAVHARASRITPDTKPLWGKMNAPQMVVHITDALHMATGALPVRSKKMIVRFAPLKQLLIYVLPMPKGLPTARELQDRVPLSWSGELRDFSKSLDAFAAHDAVGTWPDHPIFGKMSRRDWGVLAYRHVDHHLRQFGA